MPRFIFIFSKAILSLCLGFLLQGCWEAKIESEKKPDATGSSVAIGKKGALATGHGTATASTPGAANLIDGKMEPDSMWDAGERGWWKYDFGAGVTKSITQYVMYGWDSSSNGPTAWSIDGSNDDDKWTTLDTQKNVDWRDGEVKLFPISKPAAYRFYRLNVTAPGNGHQARLLEMELRE